MNWANDIGSLSATGRAEAAQVGSRLKELKIHAMYTSDLKRTRETAEIISTQIGIKPITTKGLRERNLGIFGDLTYDEIRTKWPEKAVKFLDHSDKDWNGLEGESLHDVHARFRIFLKELDKKHAAENVLLVTHSGVLYTVLRDLFNFFPQDSWMDVAHTSITILEKSGNTYTLKEFNKTE